MLKKILLTLSLVLSCAPLMAKSIVVLGDSISAAYGISVDQGWVNLLQTKINTRQQPYTLVNESISGETSAGGLARINKALSVHKPDIVLLELGANDGLRGLSPKLMYNNLAEIIQRSQQSGARVLLLSMRIPPNYGKRYIDMFYNVYPTLAHDYDIPYIPFLMEDVALKKEYMQADGLHPNAKAQPLIADIVWKHLQDML